MFLTRIWLELNNSNNRVFFGKSSLYAQDVSTVAKVIVYVLLAAARTCKLAFLGDFDWVLGRLLPRSLRQSWATATCQRILQNVNKSGLVANYRCEFSKTSKHLNSPSRFSLAILLVGCLASVCAAVTTWGPYILKLISVNLADTCNDSESATCLRSLHTCKRNGMFNKKSRILFVVH